MQLANLLPIAAKAAVPLGQRVTQHLADGLSFAQTLAERIAFGETVPESSETEVDAAAAAGLAGLPNSLVHAYRLGQQRLEEFLADFHARATQYGIDRSQPIELKTDGRGNVILANHHPDRATIEQHFLSDSELTASFNRLAAAQTTAAQLHDQQRLRGEFRLLVNQHGAEVRFV